MTNGKPIQIPADSPLATLIAEAGASGAPLTVEAGGVTYELDVRSLGVAVERQDSGGIGAAPLALGPEAFYADFTRRDDIRRVLKRLAE
jgi:hypothetical protein